MKHTPGPWVKSQYNHYLAGIDVGADNGANIAFVTHDVHDRNRQETEANARLIASAPILLEALKCLYKEANISGLVDQDPSMRQARAAIAKAEDYI